MFNTSMFSNVLKIKIDLRFLKVIGALKLQHATDRNQASCSMRLAVNPHRRL